MGILGLAIVRAMHVLTVVLRIGGVGPVTTASLPAVSRPPKALAIRNSAERA